MSVTVPNRDADLKQLVQQKMCGCRARAAANIQSKSTPCKDVRTIGLVDGGFEAQLGVIGGGPGGNEVPEQADNAVTWNAVEFSDGVNFDLPVKQVNWMHERSQSTWQIVSTNPRTGTYHLRMPTSTPYSFGDVHPMTIALCSSGNYYTAYFNGGQVITLSWYTMAASTGWTIDTEWNFTTFTEGGLSGPSQFFVGPTNVSTSYTQHVHQLVAPSDAALVRVGIQLTGGGTLPVDIDDVTLSIV